MSSSSSSSCFSQISAPTFKSDTVALGMSWKKDDSRSRSRSRSPERKSRKSRSRSPVVSRVPKMTIPKEVSSELMQKTLLDLLGEQDYNFAWSSETIQWSSWSTLLNDWLSKLTGNNVQIDADVCMPITLLVFFACQNACVETQLVWSALGHRVGLFPYPACISDAVYLKAKLQAALSCFDVPSDVALLLKHIVTQSIDTRLSCKCRKLRFQDLDSMTKLRLPLSHCLECVHAATEERNKKREEEDAIKKSFPYQCESLQVITKKAQVMLALMTRTCEWLSALKWSLADETKPHPPLLAPLIARLEVTIDSIDLVALDSVNESIKTTIQ